MGSGPTGAWLIRQTTAALVVVAITAVSWLAWLPWHRAKEYFPKTDTYQDPYTSWQVGGLILTVTVVAAIGGWKRKRLGIPVVTALVVALVVMFSVNAATIPGTLLVNGRWRSLDASLWPVGAFFLAVGAALGLGLVALCSWALGRTLTRRRGSRQPAALGSDA